MKTCRVFLSIFTLTLLLLIAKFVSAAMIDKNNGTVLDTETGLVWQKGGNYNIQWKTALSYCEGLTLGEKSDWRLPTLNELITLMDDSRINPSIDPIFGLQSGYHSHWYWTSTTNHMWQVGSTPEHDKLAWEVTFELGSFMSEEKTCERNCRCVRGGSVSSDPHVYKTSPSQISPDAKNITLDIYGKNFSNAQGSPKVRALSSAVEFNNQDSEGWAQTQFIDREHITVVINKISFCQDDYIGLAVKNSDGGSGQSPAAIRLKAPKILSISPEQASIRDTNIAITITGENFYYLGNEYPLLYIEGAVFASEEENPFIKGNLVSDTEIRFSIPKIDNTFQKERALNVILGKANDGICRTNTVTLTVPDSISNISPILMILGD